MRSMNERLAITLMVAISGCSGIEADAPAQIGEARQAATPAPEVTVINTTNNPVPTLATGTTNVAGSVGATQSGTWNVGAAQSGSWNVGAAQSGSWNVGAAQSGSWNVGVSGTVAVSNFPSSQTVAVSNFPSSQTVAVSNFPSSQTVAVSNFPSSQTVQVGNTATNPVLIRDTDARARQPFQSTFGFHLLAGADGAAATYLVPAGKRLVIERASALLYTPTGPAPELPYVEILTTKGTHYLPVTRLGSDGAYTYWIMNEQTLAYEEPNFYLIVEGLRLGDKSNALEVTVTVSGYFIDL